MADDDQTPTAPGAWPPPPGSLPSPPSGPPAYPPPYGQPMPSSPPGKKKRFGWLALALAFVGGGLVSFVVVVGAIAVFTVGGDNFDSDEHGPVAEGAAIPQVGDCLGPSHEEVDVTSDAQVVDCAEAHSTEISAVIEVPGGSDLPGEDDLGYLGDDACFLAFEGYVGDYDSSPHDYGWIVPNRAAWDAGDRTLWCVIEADGAVGTVRNTSG